MPVLARARRRARRTHSSMFSASFRQGITTETSGAASIVRGQTLPGRVSLLDRAHAAARQAAERPSDAVITRRARRKSRRSRRDRSARSGNLRCQLMRICLVYDCLFPYTVGGGRALVPQPRGAARRGRPRGHLSDAAPVGPRARRRASPASASSRSGPRMALYSGAGRRRILPPLVFGAGVLWHLLRHGRRYDVVHTASFPYFSLLAAALVAAARPLPARRRLARGVDARPTGASTSGRVGGRRSAGSCSGCARACRSRRSASRGCTPRGCATRA